MFIRSNGKIRLSDNAYRVLLVLCTITFPTVAAIWFVLSLFWPARHDSLLFGLLAIGSLISGALLRITETRRLADNFAYDGLVTVVGATEGRAKQIIFRLYKGPEALDTASTILLKVDHGSIPIVEFDDDEYVEGEDDSDEEPRK